MPLHDQTYKSHSLRRHQRRQKFRTYLAITAILTVLIGSTYVLFGSHRFRINQITVTGIEPVHYQAILDALKPRVITGFWRGMMGADHFWSWPDELQFSDTRIKAVRVEKNLNDHTLTLVAVPRERFLIWCRGLETSSCYWVDDAGVAFMEAPQTQGQLVFSLNEADVRALTLGEAVTVPAHFDAIKKILEGVKAIGIAKTGAVLDRNLQELHLRTVSGTKLLFSVRFDPTVAALPGLVEFAKSLGLSTLNYVDMTVENRAFYQPR